MHEPIRILDLRDSPWVDGPGRTILETAEHIDRSRFDVTIGGFVSGDPGQNSYLTEARNRGLTVQEIEERRAIDPAALRSIVRIVKDDKVDLIHTHDFRTDLMGVLAANRCGVPVISTCHGWIANNLKGKVYKLVDLRLLRRFDHVITVSEMMKRQLLDSGIREAKLTAIPNALVVDDFIPDKRDRVFREELGVGEGTALIVKIGRLSPEKGHGDLLQALAGLRDTHPDFVLAIVGIGPEEAPIKALCVDLGLDEKVRFVGFRSDMTAIYNSADLLVQSSFTEGMPNVVLESLLMETPVIATCVGGTDEIVEHGVSGFLVPPHSVEQLHNGFRDFFANRAQHARMASNGRQVIIERFNHADRVSRISELYSSVAGESVQ